MLPNALKCLSGIAMLGSAMFAIAQPNLTEVTRQPDAYDAWKLALTPGTATDPATITVPAGFKVELLRSATPEEDSWVSMAFDPQGRLTIAREKKGLLRMTPGAGRVDKVEVINDTLLECRGLLYAGGALYADANNSKLFCRLRDTDGDDQFDQIDELLRTDGGVGHGRNHVKLGPDGMIYLAHGNNVVVPSNAARESPLRNFQDDRLIPCPWDPQMFDGDVKLPAGHILRGDPDGRTWTLIAGGLRNPLDVAFNEDGEMFTFDADMEWDTGTPWYRPNRVNHIVSGADYGWRRGTSKWPEYFPDCGPTVLDIGLASPTGIEVGTRSHFPPEMRRALFISDWAYGRIVAVHLQPRGASYTATAEHFVVGRPLNVTDLAFGPDGAMYFITGGRRTQSGLYRVSYTGPKFEHAPPLADEDAAKARALRRQLEAFHGHSAPDAVEKIWPHLGSEDPWIRHAARIALEWQDVKQWQSRALAEKDTLASLTALLALTRSAASDAQQPLLEKLNALPFASLPEEQQVIAARDYQLAFIRLGTPEPALAAACKQRLDALYPAKSWRVNHLLCELLAYLKAPAFRDKTIALLTQATRSEDMLHYLFHLRLAPDGWTPEQRRTAFAALNHAETLEGARDYQRSLKMIRAEMLEKLTPAEHEAVSPLVAAAAQAASLPASSGPQVLVGEWKFEELLPLLDRVAGGRSFDAGKHAFAAAQCVLCHRMGQTGGLLGPDLTAVASRFNRRDLLDSILSPSRVIDDKFRNTIFTLKNGATVLGTIEREDEKTVTIRTSPLLPQTSILQKADLHHRDPSPISPMPSGLLNVLTQNQILDLLAYLESGGDPKHHDYHSQ
ncbi:MAG: heme-binding protein [Chthoniobacteraceae bacterium]